MTCKFTGGCTRPTIDEKSQLTCKDSHKVLDLGQHLIEKGDKNCMTIAHQLFNLGTSIWYDNIRRSLIESGELQSLIDQGVRGITSNPSIFQKAIAGSDDYDKDLQVLVDAGRSVNDIYETLAMEDIRRAADLLRPLYDESNGLDGYVSLEVSPKLSYDTQGTIEEAARFFAALNRPNIMIKVPATPEGLPAIETLISQGININVTLMFSQQQYRDVANAYISGLEKLAENGGNLRNVASVASFFISRVDSKIDAALEGLGNRDLQGKIAIANGKIVYQLFEEIFSGERWESLAAKGASVQRVLWASTSTKNPSYSDTLYVDNLIGPATVNTVPPETLTALLDHATPATTVSVGVDEAQAQLQALAEVGVDLDKATDELLSEGVKKFADAFEGLMDSIAEKRERLLAGEKKVTARLGEYQANIDAALAKMDADTIIKRIWNLDHTVWHPEPQEITNRLGWLYIAEEMKAHVDELQAFADTVRQDGFTHVLLLGMGGSSLAPEVFRQTFGVKEGYLDLAILDSTDPDYVRAYERDLDLSRTVFIVATKSGGTVETLSFFKYFYNAVMDIVGPADVGNHFIAITDPGSKLETLAEAYDFRATFLNNPNIGGRYSTLSYFGLLPAALLGVDIGLVLERALQSSAACASSVAALKNDGAVVGAMMGELAKAGRDKLTFITSPQLENFGDWVEQLIAESTGKNGKGILPVVREHVGSPDVYGDDRVFVYMHLKDEKSKAAEVEALVDAGFPVLTLMLDDVYDLGEQYFLWEFATAVAGYVLGIQPFDQPNVESAKIRAREMVTAYIETGTLPSQEVALRDGGISVYGDVSADTVAEALEQFLAQTDGGDYVVLQAYVPPTAAATTALQDLRHRIRNQYKVATALGYGPRFLHSTGQLHKGDAGNGLFIQFTSHAQQDTDIPDEAGDETSSMTFGVLKLAQALGDRQALLDNQRRVIRFDLGSDVLSALQVLNG